METFPGVEAQTHTCVVAGELFLDLVATICDQNRLLVLEDALVTLRTLNLTVLLSGRHSPTVTMSPTVTSLQKQTNPSTGGWGTSVKDHADKDSAMLEQEM
ncbi:hypothetical protein EYF80_048656 [Liparis tanakae]|uniref:Uncharacterized protein n=1 Tax=Liparis tanakae TaxID=230148 RepID=A0A4Z2FJ02_9TELE|nr:hypothetical protein EYF80_048656 [Liparis tanakae]